MTKMKNITGKRFGLLTAKEPYEYTRHGWTWLCACDCGRESIHRIGHLTSGNTKSCGCLRIKFAREIIKRANNGRLCPQCGASLSQENIDKDVEEFDRELENA
jgi:hypothetical protein